MKLSTFYRNLGWNVYLNKTHSIVDKIYASCVFTWNKKKLMARLKSINRIFPDIDIEMGGYAIDSVRLSPEIDGLMPDYDLYGVDYSMGFTSRGCIRKCPFCIVHKNEGNIHPVSDIYSFWDRRHEKIVLMDNNLLASSECDNVLKSLIKEKLRVDFNQGLDIRLVNEDNAKLLSQVKTSVLRFSLDAPHVEKDFIKGIEILKKNKVSLSKIVVYVLIGYNTTFEEDMERFRILSDYGMSAFPMIFRDENGNYKVRPKGNKEGFKKCRMPQGSLCKLLKFYGIFTDKNSENSEDIYKINVRPMF